jgi:iron(III) transport system permease protein
VTTLRQQLASPLQLVALASATLILLPLGYVTTLAISADTAVWRRLWATRIPELLTNTVSLAGAVALLTLLLGVSTAWLVTRFEFPGRRLWEVALVLPLAMPTYVLAYIYNYLLGFGGPVELLWQAVAGPEARIFSPQSFWGATLVMALDTFPFVYLLTRSALLSLNVSFEEVARTCGASRTQTLWRVTLPLLRPSIVAGLALVILYVVSDFGAVSLLRYQTLTYAVFQQMTGRSDNTAAGILSILLVGLALAFLVTERWFRHKSRFYQTTGRYRSPERLRCGWLKSAAATGYLAAIVGVFSASCGTAPRYRLSPRLQAC